MPRYEDRPASELGDQVAALNRRYELDELALRLYQFGWLRVYPVADMSALVEACGQALDRLERLEALAARLEAINGDVG